MGRQWSDSSKFVMCILGLDIQVLCNYHKVQTRSAVCGCQIERGLEHYDNVSVAWEFKLQSHNLLEVH